MMSFLGSSRPTPSIVDYLAYRGMMLGPNGWMGINQALGAASGMSAQHSFTPHRRLRQISGRLNE